MKFKLIALSAMLSALCLSALAQGTAFTYQGRLMDTGAPANGLYDIRAGLYPASSGGVLSSALYTNSAVAVSNGLFTITLDFGGLFNGTPYWLQIGVRTNGAGAAFMPLSPRQELTPTPYAIFAEGASTITGVLPSGGLSGNYSGAVNFNNLNDSFSGNGGGLTNVNAATLSGVAATGFWMTVGNAGTSPSSGNFVGTTDNNPLELHVNGMRGIRLEPTLNDANHASIVNVVDGSPVNFAGAGVYGATISGGGANNYFGSPGTNSVTADFGTVGGGVGNTASGAGSVIGGGGWEGSIVYGNTASGTASVIGGGINNIASFFTATVAGGYDNTASGNSFGATTVGGGVVNTASSDFATVSGGINNIASGVGSFVGGGGSDGSTSPPFGLVNTWPNKASGKATAIGGGLGNTNLGYGATIAGGTFNTANGTNATVGGGSGNGAIGTAYGYSTVSGGSANTAVSYATVGGGIGNTANGFASFVGGGGFAGATYAGNYAGGAASMIGGGLGNTTSSEYATVEGGYYNSASGGSSVIGGGNGNTNNGDFGTLSGGVLNLIHSYSLDCTIGGGYLNTIQSDATHAANYSTIGGGDQNTISKQAVTATIGGGGLNTIGASGSGCTISGGGNNSTPTFASYATIPGGTGNTAGSYAFAAGTSAHANDQGAFVWADSSAFVFSSAAQNEFAARATGGARFVTAINGSGTPTAGVSLASGGTSWGVISDRNAKKNFAPVDGEEVLSRLAQVPVQQWNYKWEADDSVPHIGPMAQDFKQAFYPGRDNKSITTLEFDGVELAAIQGLNQKLNEKEAEIQGLKQRLEKLERLLTQKNGGEK